MIELLYTLGKRTERLLYLGVLLSVVCIALYFVSSSAEHMRTKALGNSLTAILSCLDEGKMKEIRSYYDSVKDLRSINNGISFMFGLTKCPQTNLMELHGRFGAYDEISNYIDKLGNRPPDEIRTKIGDWTAQVRSNPARFYEFEIPSEIAIDIAGNRVASPLTALFALLRIALGPIVFLWAASLYCTRANELVLINSTSSDLAAGYASLFPHILNTFPLIDDLPRTRKTPKTKHLVATHTAFRALVMAALMAAPVCLYTLMMLGVALDSYSFLAFAASLLAIMFIGGAGISCVALEMTPAAREIIFISRRYGRSSPK